MHVYAGASGTATAVQDASDTATTDAPSFVEPDEQITGFAYDPFTDHFFLRLAPGNRIRVVDRPARAIKREFVVAGLPATGGGDLTVRPRDGHLFLLPPAGREIAEVTRLGKLTRTFELAGIAGVPRGIAYDSGAGRLLVLNADGRRVTAHDFDGRRLGEFDLEREGGAALAIDADKREIYAPLAGEKGIVGVFNETGRLLRTLALPAAFVDVGPRSFVRVF